MTNKENKKSKSTMYSFHLTHDQLSELRSRSSETKTPVSAYIRQGIDMLLERLRSLDD